MPVVVKNKPMAENDSGATSEGASFMIDVMANDAGGGAKTLRSVHQTNPALPTTTAFSAMGATISIVNGQVSYTASGSQIDALAAGQTATDTFIYTIQMGGGIFSTATVSVLLTGVNDAPTIVSGGTTDTGRVSERADGAADEGTAVLTATGAVAFADVDLTDVHAAAVTPVGEGYVGTLVLGDVDQAGDAVGWTFSVSDADLDFLGAGEPLVQTYTVTVSDNHGGSVEQTITVTITGAADPVGGGGGGGAPPQTNIRVAVIEWNTEPGLTNALTGLNAFQSVTRIGDDNPIDDLAPTLEDLMQYDVVVFTPNMMADDSAAFGDVLADYIDAGGHVVMTTFGFQLSNFFDFGRLEDGYLPYDSYLDNYERQVTEPLPEHPLFDLLFPVNQISAFYRDELIPSADATVLGTWSDGTALALIDQGSKVIGLTIYPEPEPNPEFATTGEAVELVANAIAYSWFYL
jgi:VCBS repeat-containing protein